MAVQKSRKTPSKRGMHRSHDGLSKPALSIDPQSGETHLRHRVTPDGFYRGKIAAKNLTADERSARAKKAATAAAKKRTADRLERERQAAKRK